jgi:hypothetical protein
LDLKEVFVLEALKGLGRSESRATGSDQGPPFRCSVRPRAEVFNKLFHFQGNSQGPPAGETWYSMSSPHLSSSSRGRTTGRGLNAGQGVDSQEKERFERAEMVADGGFFEEQFGLTLLQSAVGGEIRCGQVQT